jgi:hypothetical protein
MSMNGYYSTKELKARGWSEKLIRTFLGAPDRTLPNPYFNHGHEKRLYSASRVAQVESSFHFMKEHAASREVSGRIRGALDRKREELEKLVSLIDIPPLPLSEQELMSKVVTVRQTTLMLERRSEGQVALDILLDTMKSLEWHLDPFMWHPGIRHARKLLRGRMLAHIIDHYPVLAAAARERGEQDNGDP